MELAEIISRRAVPGAGLLVSLTSRCPLRCAHCSTASTLAGPQPEAAGLRRFLSGWTGADRPDVVFFTGGEPLLRPGLLAELAREVAAAGSATAALTGGFFARGGRIPDRIRAVLEALDHVSFSLDAFHEREVARADVFAALRVLLDRGRPVSLHLVGHGDDDPYLDDVIGSVRKVFGTAVPMLAGRVEPVGRARGWLEAGPVDGGTASPCALAAWPVVRADGRVTACCAPDVAGHGEVPEHLLLGDIAVDRWPVVRERLLGAPLLRAVRAAGPHETWRRFGPAADGVPAGPCAACRALCRHPGLVAAAGAALSGPGGRLLDLAAAERSRAAGPVALLRRYGVRRHAGLVDPTGLGRAG